MKVYLDNVIVSGITRRDLTPAAEMTAVLDIVGMNLAGRLEIACVTSRETWREQDKTKDRARRSLFEQDRPKIPVVPADHQLIGSHNSQDHLGGFCVCPIITDTIGSG